MGYTVAKGKTFHPVGCRTFRGGQPVPENIVAMMREIGNLSGLLSAGVLIHDNAEPVTEHETVKRGPGRPAAVKFSQIDDAVSAQKLIDESSDSDE